MKSLWENSTKDNFSAIQGLEHLNIKDLNSRVLEFLNDKMDTEEFRLTKLAVVGSRVNGIFREDSDLDIAFEYIGAFPSYSLCDFLNEEPLFIECIGIDFIPYGLNKGEKMKLDLPMIHLEITE